MQGTAKGGEVLAWVDVGERGRARASCRQVGHGGARDAGRMSAAPIVDDLIVERDAEAAADRLLRDQAPVAEDMDGKAARSGRSMRWLGSAELAPSVCACCSPAGSSCHAVGWVGQGLSRPSESGKSSIPSREREAAFRDGREVAEPRAGRECLEVVLMGHRA